MDIKESLGKIEQYWQIIRNLHFHIEQEGRISPEEHALIDKYLKVISGKYAALVTGDEAEKVQAIAQVVQAVQEVRNHEPAPIPVQPSVMPFDVAETENMIAEVAIDASVSREIGQPSVEVGPTLLEVLPMEMQAAPASDNSLSSMLERMLDEPSSVAAAPVVVEPAAVKKPATFNERMMESQVNREDINTRIKKTMAETISLNEKFEFIRELFGNNPVDYATALSYIDARSESHQAWAKVESEFAEKYKWSTKPGSVEKLKKVLERRFQ